MPRERPTSRGHPFESARPPCSSESRGTGFGVRPLVGCREPEPSPLPCESSCAHFVRTLRAHNAARHGHGGLAVSRADRSRSSAKPRQSARVIRAVSARGRFSSSPTPQLQRLATVIRAAQESSSARPLCAPSPPGPLTPHALQTAPALAERLRDGPAWVYLRPTVSASLSALRGRFRAGGIRCDGMGERGLRLPSLRSGRLRRPARAESDNSRRRTLLPRAGCV